MERQPRGQIISVKRATLWHYDHKDEHKNLLSVEFNIPNNLARQFSPLSEEQAEIRNATVMADFHAAMGNALPEDIRNTVMASYDPAAEALATQTNHGAVHLNQKILGYLRSEGFPAAEGARGGGSISHDFTVTMNVDVTPEKVLGLAETLNDAGLLEQRVLLSKLKAEKNIQTNPPAIDRFIIDLNAGVLGPSGAKELPGK